MNTMMALVKEGRRVGGQRVPVPTLNATDDVLLRVAVAGICRTDIYAAKGLIPCSDPLILGHEFSAVVHDVGPAVDNVRTGDRVTVMPWVPCGDCRACQEGAGVECAHRRMLGVDRHGGFAEFVVVPAHTVYRLPDTVSLKAGAYAEPVAASLAVLKAGLCPEERGLLYGNNRIALLTRAILSIHGFHSLTLWDPEDEGSGLDAEGYDFAIETVATKQALSDIVRAVRPRGKIILKSRPFQSVPLDIRTAVLKELTFHAVNYGSFDEAIALLGGSLLRLDELLGAVYRLEEYERAFAASECNESAKTFFGFVHDAE